MGPGFENKHELANMKLLIVSALAALALAEPEASIGYGGLGYGGLGLGYGGYGLGYSGLRLGGIGLRGGYGLWKREADPEPEADAEPEAEASIGYGGLGYGAIAAPVAITAPVVTRTIAVAQPAITTTVLSGGLHSGLLGGYGGLRGGLWKREATSEADAEPEPSIGYGGLGYGGLGLGYGGYGLGYSGLRLGGIGLRGGYGLWKREADSEPEAEASIG